MYFGDHPPPQFHVRYGEHKARLATSGGELIDGALPPRAARLVRKRTALHEDEPRELEPVEPLQ